MKEEKLKLKEGEPAGKEEKPTPKKEKQTHKKEATIRTTRINNTTNTEKKPQTKQLKQYIYIYIYIN